MLHKGDVGVFQIITYCVFNTKFRKSMKVYHYIASSERVKL